jgi:hypothetical protein
VLLGVSSKLSKPIVLNDQQDTYAYHIDSCMQLWLALYLTRNHSFSLLCMLSFDQEKLNYQYVARNPDSWI